jgi:hypothetical protein
MHQIKVAGFQHSRVRIAKASYKFIGNVSCYGRFADGLVVLAAATAVSYISRWFYEHRFLKWKQRPVKLAR